MDGVGMRQRWDLSGRWMKVGVVRVDSRYGPCARPLRSFDQKYGFVEFPFECIVRVHLHIGYLGNEWAPTHHHRRPGASATQLHIRRRLTHHHRRRRLIVHPFVGMQEGPGVLHAEAFDRMNNFSPEVL